MKSSPRVFKIGSVISFSLSSDEDTKKKQYYIYTVFIYKSITYVFLFAIMTPDVYRPV